MSHRVHLILALVAAVFLGSWLPRLTAPICGSFSEQKTEEAGAQSASKTVENLLRLDQNQIDAAKITTEEVRAGVLRRKITAPAAVTPDPDLVGHVAAKVAGTVAELRKKLGDPVTKGEIIAVIDSREVADAKSEYLAAVVNFDLQRALFQREKGLYEKQITAEQLFLKARTVYTEAKLRLDLAQQKLASLDLSEEEIAALPRQPVATLRRKEIHAPITGRVTDRLVSLGQPVGGEGQSKELYILADLSTVEADLAVPVADLPFVREKQAVTIMTPEGREVSGEVVFVNSTLTPETRSGHVIASFPNRDFALRPGSLLNARVILQESRAGVLAPRAAIQMIANENVVFVRNAEGFEKRVVEIGAKDDDYVEVKSGLKPGEVVAVNNSFVLKAELGKNDIPQE